MPEQAPDVLTIAALLREQAANDPAIAALPAPLREGHALRHVLDRLPIGLTPDEDLAGDCGWHFASAAQQAELIHSSPALPTPAPTDPTPLQLLDHRFNCSANYTLAHTLLDYERVVTAGLGAIVSEIETHLPAATGPQQDTLRAMLISLEAVVHLAARYAALAREAASEASPGADRERLFTLAGVCDRVPFHPAASFHEALQSIWFMHLAVGLSEYSSASLSLGRLDQYLYPLYCADLESGVAPEALRGLLADLWRKLNRFGDPACAVNLGGLSPEGQDLLNPLSDLIIDLTRDLRLPAPILAARVHPQMPVEVFDALLDPALLTMGQPTFYGELPCREAMRRRGVPEADLHRFALNSCMGLVIPGEEISDMWGAVANLLLPLELATNAGAPFRHELPLQLGPPPPAGYLTFDELYDQFAATLDELIAFLVAANQSAAAAAAEQRPNPFLSALTHDCVARGLDRAGGGARYHCVIIEGFGWANVADALVAIDRLVFQDHAYTLGYLVQAARDDFRGHDALRQDILRQPKYGNGDAEADAMAARVTATFARLVSRHSQGSRYYLPSYHTLIAHLWAGEKLPASLDGRHAGEPLGKNAGPVLGRARQGLTGVLLSASSIPQADLSGGQALDISLQPSHLASIAGKRAFQSLLQTYFQRGGIQVQVNGLTAADLRAAIASPETHRDLIVRIAGYSAPFTTLSATNQHEMAARLDQGL